MLPYRLTGTRQMTEMTTREQYLVSAIHELAASVFGPADYEIPADVKVTCGWPSKGGLASRRKTVGQCFARSCSDVGVNEIFISPTQADTSDVLDILTHELVHAIDDCENGHRAPFRRIAIAVGLTGKMTATVAGDALRSKFVDIQKKLGNYPHAAIDLSGLKKQKSRQLKIECLDCGAVWRMSRKWLAQVTACPVCQSGNIKSV